MRNTTRRLLGAAALLALSATGLLGGTASASPGDTPPPAGDPRAVSAAKNLEWNHDNACAKAGLAGEAFDEKDEQGAPTLPSTQTETHLTITGGLEGYTVTGVVVKGGDGYNVYTAEKLGDLAWTDLHSPLNNNGKPAGISHWFFCAEKDDTVTTTTPASTTSSTPATTTDETTPTTTTTESVAVTPTTTSTPAAAGADNENDLANTGFDGGWMLIVGLGLVAAGAAFVASPKLRTLLRR